jgi:phosphoglycolate phosphatase-like HAD superfamily hydrolase
LYDWVSYFVPSFYAMLDVAVQIVGCDREKLLDDFRAVHQRHQDSEHPFALLETDAVRQRFDDLPIREVAQILDPAFHAFNSARRRNLQLHDGVKETLDFLTRSGTTLVAHTESKLYAAMDRLERLDLFRYFSKVYCRERSAPAHPNLHSPDWLDRFPMNRVTELSHQQAKPNPTVLSEICADEGVLPQHAAYVGDSIGKDVLMAKRAGVFAIWAAYGDHHDAVTYGALVRISHWTREEVVKERQLREEARMVRPDYVAHRSFKEVIAALEMSQ